MSDSSQGPGWWQASDGKWYPPEQAQGAQAQPAAAAGGGAPGKVQLDIGKALGYGWNGLIKNFGTIILLIIVVIAVQLFFSILGQTTSNIVLSLIFAVIGIVISLMISVGFIRAALAIVEGEKPEVSMLFQGEHIGSYLIASILVGLMIMVGLVFCVVGALVVWFFVFFYGYFIVDKNMGPTDGISASFNLVKENSGNLLVFLLVSIVLTFCTCGLAWPVVWIAGAYVYKTLNGEPVAELT